MCDRTSRTIGEKLNVTTVLEGSVRRAGDRVRITVRLSEVASWLLNCGRSATTAILKDIFDVQDEIAKVIVERLRVTLAAGKDRLVEQATRNIEADQLYLKGRALVDCRGASVPAGLDLLRRAVELDPGYSLAWAGVADALTVLAYSGAARGSDTKPQAMAAAKRSIALDPGSAPGHTALACAVLLYENDRAMARQEFERALELSPNYEMGRCWYANFYLNWARGDYGRAIAEARRALESDPLSVYATMNLGVCLFTAGRLDQAIEACRWATQMDPELFVALLGSASHSDSPDDLKRRSPHSRLPQRCRGATRSPSPLWLECSGRETACGGAGPASRTRRPGLARLCLGCAPGPHRRGRRTT